MRADEPAGETSAVAPIQSGNEEIPFEDLGQVFRSDDVPIDFPGLEPWQRADRCGLNCVYVFLRLLEGRTIDYRQVSQAAGPMPEGGLTLQQLKEICQRFGVACDVVRGSPRSLNGLPPPAIIHLGELGTPGHYICYYERAGEPPTYRFLDGTSGMTLSISESQGQSLDVIARQSSGYMLVPARPLWQKVVIRGGQLLWIAAGLVWLEFLFRWKVQGRHLA